MILVTDFTEQALKSYKIYYFIKARKECIAKLHFYQSEFNLGRTTPSIINAIEYWKEEIKKWDIVIQQAEVRDKKAKDLWDSKFE